MNFCVENFLCKQKCPHTAICNILPLNDANAETDASDAFDEDLIAATIGRVLDVDDVLLAQLAIGNRKAGSFPFCNLAILGTQTYQQRGTHSRCY